MAASINPEQMRLVCLHIPKTAGSSLRETIKVVYGVDRMHWFKEDDPEPEQQRYHENAVTEKLFLGGHRPLAFYPQHARNLYFAALRHPVERVRSLFSYYTRPEEAASESSVAERQRVKEQWMRQGIVPESLLQSIERCKPFRLEIQNQQCHYLSAGAPTFAAALKTLERGNFLVGNSTNLGPLLDTLGHLFHWPETKEVRTNVSVAVVEDDILSEPGVVERILECTAEDAKLYDYVLQQHGGLYVNLPDSEALLASPLYFAGAQQREFSRLAWGKVALSAVGQLDEILPGESSVRLKLRNGAREFLNPEQLENIGISYRFLDQQGEVIERETPRSPLHTMVGPGEDIEVPVRVVIPDDLPQAASAVKFSVKVEKRFWLYRLCPGHGLDVPVRREFSRQAWSKVVLSAVDALDEIRPGKSRARLLLRNGSLEALSPQSIENIFISYILLDQQGEIIKREAPRTPLQATLEPGESIELPVRVVIPDDLPQPAAAIRFSVMVEKRYWVYRLCPGHGLEVPVLPPVEGNAKSTAAL
jgi:Sulfotransferase family